MFEITFTDTSETEYMDYTQCIEVFGEDKFEEIRKGFLPHIVAIEIDDVEDDGQPDELTEWMDFDPDC